VFVSIHCLIASTQSQSITKELVLAFRSHGWSNISATCFNNLRPDIYGVGIGLPASALENFGDVPSGAEAVRRILAAGGLDPTIGIDSSLDSGFMYGSAIARSDNK
jgi:hypothetical protein